MPSRNLPATVIAVSRDSEHRFSKPVVDAIVLIEGWGIEGDTHAGVTVQHRSRVARDPTQPNLRQVHLIHAELFDEVAAAGYHVEPGQLGENVTTRGLNLLALPTGALLLIWVAVDVVGVPLLISAGYYASASMYVFYGVFTLVGFFIWARDRRRNGPPAASIPAPA